MTQVSILMLDIKRDIFSSARRTGSVAANNPQVTRKAVFLQRGQHNFSNTWELRYVWITPTVADYSTYGGMPNTAFMQRNRMGAGCGLHTKPISQAEMSPNCSVFTVYHGRDEGKYRFIKGRLLTNKTKS